MLDLSYDKDRRKAIVFDGTGKYIQMCNLCSRRDLVLPINGFYVCPRCLRKGSWELSQLHVYSSGYCDICGVHAIGAIAYVKYAMACFRCMWTKLSKRKDALRPDGFRIV
jgi:hypothetical protein